MNAFLRVQVMFLLNFTDLISFQSSKSLQTCPSPLCELVWLECFLLEKNPHLPPSCLSRCGWARPLTLTASGISRQEFVLAPVIAAGWDFYSEGATKKHVIIIFVDAELWASSSQMPVSSRSGLSTHCLHFFILEHLGVKQLREWNHRVSDHGGVSADLSTLELQTFPWSFQDIQAALFAGTWLSYIQKHYWIYTTFGKAG